jgi:predicted transcriptional regulator
MNDVQQFIEDMKKQKRIKPLTKAQKQIKPLTKAQKQIQKEKFDFMIEVQKFIEPKRNVYKR